MSDNAVVLKTGQRVDRGLVETVFMTLDLLQKTGQIMAIHELLKLSRDPSHRPFGNTGQTLKSYGLLESWDPAKKQGNVWRAMADIVLAAVEEAPGGVKVAASPQDIIR